MIAAQFFYSRGFTHHGRGCDCQYCSDPWSRFCDLWARLGECRTPSVWGLT